MTEKLKRLIEIAQAEVGYHEGYNNNNKYGLEYGFNNAAWCCIFCWWICKHAGVPFPTTAHCNQVEAYAREHGQWVTAPYEVGDFVVWNYDHNWENDHIGLIIAKSGNVFTTIEGNSHDAVSRNTYSNLEGIVGAYRPDYGEDVPDINVGEKDDVVGDEPNVVSTTQVELPTIQKGDMLYNPYVELAMYLLRMHDCPPQRSLKISGRYDGEAGDGFWVAVDVFQTLNNISETDMIGEQTWTKLLSFTN